MNRAWDDISRPVLSMRMDGGRACLDLLNTRIPAVPVPASPGTERDLLATYADLVGLAVRAAILPSEEAAVLLSLSEKDKVSEASALDSAKSFRSLFLRLVLSFRPGAAPAMKDLASFDELRAAARSFEILFWDNHRFRLRARFQAEGLASPLHAFIRDADELLRSPECSRVRVVRSGTPDSRFILG